MTVPTVDDMLRRTDAGNQQHRWPTDGGSITVDRATLRQALEAAYDPTMLAWPSLVDLADA